MAKVLILEDDKFLVRVYKLKLEQAGFEVSFFENGAKALENLDIENPNVLILDLSLPGVDGFEIIREIRKNEKYKNLPIIVLSALHVEKDMKEAVDLGATEYLTKSEVEVKGVIESVKKYLN